MKSYFADKKLRLEINSLLEALEDDILPSLGLSCLKSFCESQQLGSAQSRKDRRTLQGLVRGSKAEQPKEVLQLLNFLRFELGSILEDFQFNIPVNCNSLKSYQRFSIASRQTCGVYMMLWPPNCSSPIHDHSFTWCYEKVCVGRLEVEEYRLSKGSAELTQRSEQLELESVKQISQGQSAFLFPPNDIHAVRNPQAKSCSLSMNLYGISLDSCRVFQAPENHCFTEDGPADCQSRKKELFCSGDLPFEIALKVETTSEPEMRNPNSSEMKNASSALSSLQPSNEELPG